MDIIRAIEAKQIKENAENFNVGDTVRVSFKIVEGATERIQVFEGIVIAKNNTGVRRTFVVRKISYGVGVERIFPLHSPRVEKIEVVRRGRVRRAEEDVSEGQSSTTSAPALARAQRCLSSSSRRMPNHKGSTGGGFDRLFLLS